MAEPKKPAIDLVNSSGFLFQTAVARKIRTTSPKHGWAVVAEEHYWRHPKTGEEGFIDLVIHHQSEDMLRLVIECKRASNRDWVFLTPDPDPSGIDQEPRENVRISSLAVLCRGDDQHVFGWCDLNFLPRFPESQYCVVQGQGDKDKPMLERYADSLLPSVEALAHEEVDLYMAYNPSDIGLYIPVVVTNAHLKTCTYDPGDVDALGQIDPAKAVLTSVDAIRFRKGLVTHFPGPGSPNSLTSANLLGARTVLIINSDKLPGILADLKGDPRFKGHDLQRLRTRMSGYKPSPE